MGCTAHKGNAAALGVLHIQPFKAVPAVIDAVETTDPEAILAQGSAAEDGKVIVIRDGGELEKSSDHVISETAGST